MQRNSACFIIFLIAIFFAVPVMSTLLIYEIEVVRDISHNQGIDYSTASFLTDSGDVLYIALDPIMLDAQTNVDMAPFDSGDQNRQTTRVEYIYRYSGLFARDQSKPHTAAKKLSRQANPHTEARSVASAFTLQLPKLGNRPAFVVVFNRTSELPTSATMFFLGTGLIGIAGLRRKKYKKRIRRYRRII